LHIIGAGNDYLKDDTMKQIRGILASDLLKNELGIDKIEAISSGLLSLIRPDKVGQAESSTPTTTPESAKTQPKSPAQSHATGAEAQSLSPTSTIAR